MNFLGKIITFLKEVRIEVKKVNWPTREEVWRNTLLVIAVSFVVALYLGGIDFIFTKILNTFILK